MIFKRLKRAAKVSRKYSNRRYHLNDIISSIHRKSVEKWKQYSLEEVLTNSSVNNFSDFDITQNLMNSIMENA